MEKIGSGRATAAASLAEERIRLRFLELGNLKTMTNQVAFMRMLNFSLKTTQHHMICREICPRVIAIMVLKRRWFRWRLRWLTSGSRTCWPRMQWLLGITTNLGICAGRLLPLRRRGLLADDVDASKESHGWRNVSRRTGESADLFCLLRNQDFV